MDQQENSKPAQQQRQNETFPRYFPGKGHGAGEVTASEIWKVRRAHASARRSLAAPAPLLPGAAWASGAQALQHRRAPRGPRPPARSSDSAPPAIPPITWRSPPPSCLSPSPSRRAASQWEAEPSAQCAQPAPSRLRARKANPTRRGRRSGPTACRRAPPAAASSSPRIGCTVPTRKSSSAARLRRASAMTQEYDK